MKVTLISLHPEILSIGIRAISACLKKEGHQAQLIFLPSSLTIGSKAGKFISRFSAEVLVEIATECLDSDLVGISLTTNYFEKAVELTQFLKRHRGGTPILWGGIHPTVRPQECLEHADMICIGEGEQAVVELVEKMSKGDSYLSTRNLWFRKGKAIIKNKLRPLIQDLDSLPFPDCELSGHFVEYQNRLCQLDEDILRKLHLYKSPLSSDGIVYLIMTSRGCPHSCSYCCNDFLRNQHHGEPYLRRRSPQNVIDELITEASKIPNVEAVNFVDDNFTALRLSDLQQFLHEYKKQVGLPFHCNVSPTTISPQKMNLLAESGMYSISLGIQSGSERIQKLYNRNIPTSKALQALQVIQKFKYRMQHDKRTSYHFIIDNPYETAQDKIDTMRFLLEIPTRSDALCFSLVLFPETDIAKKAKKDGLMSDEMTQVFRKDVFDYNNSIMRYWLKLYYANVPRPILRLFLNQKMIDMLERKGAQKMLLLITSLIRYFRKQCSHLKIIAGNLRRIFILYRHISPGNKRPG
jgi:radical SAM superfamily enzyme YgiQ (UPF0313 family)